jgi:hypothetical protein
MGVNGQVILESSFIGFVIKELSSQGEPAAENRESEQ